MTRDEEIVVFHDQLGVAIAQWSYVERELRDIVVSLFSNADLNREALSIGVFSLHGFRAKLEFSDGVITRKLARAGFAHLNDCKNPVDRARRLSQHRNKLAHRPRENYWECPDGQRVALVPWIFRKSKKKTKVPRPPDGSLRIRDIARISNDFLALATSLDNFAIVSTDCKSRTQNLTNKQRIRRQLRR